MVRLVFLAIFSLGLFSNCNSPTQTGDQPAEEPKGIALARMIWPVEIRVDKYPALGDTVELEARFRFVREDDPVPNAERLRQVLEDSVYAQHGSLDAKLDVKGKFHFFPYLNGYKSSDAVKYVAGDSTFLARMALSDSGSFRAKYRAIKADTVMVEVLVMCGYGGGFKYECFVIQQDKGLGLGDCWEKQ